MRRLLLIVLVLWGTAVSAPRVLAHAELISATPAPGSSVETLTEIRLVFSEPIGTESQIELLQDFVSVAELQPMIDPNEATVLVTAVPPLQDGVYTVQWTVTSVDGHPISGSYSLGINSLPPQPGAPWYQITWFLLGFLPISLGLVLIFRRWKPTSLIRPAKNGQ